MTLEKTLKLREFLMSKDISESEMEREKQKLEDKQMFPGSDIKICPIYHKIVTDSPYSEETDFLKTLISHFISFNHLC